MAQADQLPASPEQIAQAEADLTDFMRNMNAPRREAGERLHFYRMSRWAKFAARLAGGQADNNIDYDEMISYWERLGWSTDSAGTSHRFYRHPLVPVAINVQPRKDGKVKEYQVDQIRAALGQYTGDDKDGWLRG